MTKKTKVANKSVSASYVLTAKEYLLSLLYSRINLRRLFIILSVANIFILLLDIKTLLSPTIPIFIKFVAIIFTILAFTTSVMIFVVILRMVFLAISLIRKSYAKNLTFLINNKGIVFKRSLIRITFPRKTIKQIRVGKWFLIIDLKKTDGLKTKFVIPKRVFTEKQLKLVSKILSSSAHKYEVKK